MENPKSTSSSVSKFARFSSVGIQMGTIIALFTWLGIYIDKTNESLTPWWTIGLSIFGVIAGLILVIKEVIKISNEDDKK